MIFVLYIIIFAYCLAILALIFGFAKINSFDYLGLEPKTKFSIIVPFRNEAENLPKLLNSLSKLNYPVDLFEVILVDDNSDCRLQIADCRSERQGTDETFQISIIDNVRVSNSPKKDAISTAIQIVKTDWIITTDADCVVHKNWLSALDNYIQLHKVSMIAGAVTYHCENSFLHHFQQLDLASLQGATMGSFGLRKGFMCNGANFAYTKSFFQDLNGFDGNESIASGDDVFLLQKAIARFPEKVHYLKSGNNIVITKPENDWKSLFHQRVRWASKTGSYQSRFGIGLGLIVFGGNVGLLFVVCCLLFGKENFFLMCFLLLAKFTVDFVLIKKTNVFLKNKTHYFLISSLFYPFFSLSVALYSLFGKYEWKGRKF
ncbi:Glycosyltransferase, catalytic subunit of cellulose synthase and poly-beta-1,6-N-acetylglucosamine synthase [Flavobacterium fluvii]|uniref:Glycosyltransferase, catalytic subunit of cellulose synthase and poly-beta-1,6-N-acetylglucosamine synthase n=1 Tax=Flavobacterium fluvii TaxID=468056 RepID=A0A1M5EB57_9FLAO|nr:glycosyltransferase [Flavobacterium fluvii]SHF76493.1 Glycosyltransferase, catalytic subunit of cellulose synthase and poly-beta-1,6-N-acetylglucosamine synthase [Flavobacterium fluvii]